MFHYPSTVLCYTSTALYYTFSSPPRRLDVFKRPSASNPGCEKKILAYSPVATTALTAVAASSAARTVLSATSSHRGNTEDVAHVSAAKTGSLTANVTSAICNAVFTFPMNNGRCGHAFPRRMHCPAE